MSANQKPTAQTITGYAKVDGPTHIIGLTDLTHAVDTKSKAVLATEEAAACGMRIEMLRGQLLAEQDRFIELHNRAQEELNVELKKATGGGS